MASQDNPVALVVGASRGIGRQVAIDLAKNGYSGIIETYASYTSMIRTDFYQLLLQQNRRAMLTQRDPSLLIRTPLNLQSTLSRGKSKMPEAKQLHLR